MALIQPAPLDAYNQALLDNVHPGDWKNPEPIDRYNLVVIGAGTAGLVTAAGAAGLGAKVALIERHLMGGDCLNVGCVPSKALLRSAHALADVRDAGRFGVRVPGAAEVDFPAVMERMREIRARISPVDSARRFRDELGVDVFIGDGRFAGDDEVEVGGKRLRFARAVIATGARAFTPPIEGLAEAGYLTNENVFNLTELPERLVVIGGGPIGCELSQAMARFGSKVTLCEMGPQFLSREDPDAAAILLASMERDGIDVRLGTQVTAVEKGANGSKRVRMNIDGRSEEVEADAILVGAGRTPNIDGLDLESVGVDYDERGVTVDDNLRTTHSRIFAAGDICMQHKFTHAADFAARIVIQNSLFFGSKKLSALTVPWCTYTDPEIAHVGMYERDAREAGVEIDTYVQEFADVDRAIAEGDEEGFVKIHTKKGKDEIVGATIVARHAGEMISEVSVAMAAGMGLGALSQVIHPYPTQAEAIRKVGDQFNRTRVTPLVAHAFDKFLSLRR